MMKFTLRSMVVTASTLGLLGFAPAYAGDDSVRAEAYFNAVSSGDADAIASFYADDAEFRWIGGPLAGVYKGKDRIRGLWAKFSAAAGSFTHEVLELSEAANADGSTVTARVKLKGDGEVPVKFVMTYKGGKIASEIWQVDKTPVVAKAEPRPAAPAKPEPTAIAEPKEAAPQPRDEKVAAPASKTLRPPLPEPKPATAVAVETRPAGTSEKIAATAEQSAASEADYLPKPAASAEPEPQPEAAKPQAETKPAPKAKTAERKRKKRRYYDYEDEDYYYGRGYGRYEPYGYGRYRGWGGYGGYYGGRYGGGY